MVITYHGQVSKGVTPVLDFENKPEFGVFPKKSELALIEFVGSRRWFYVISS
jgi:hypothetical protein